VSGRSPDTGPLHLEPVDTANADVLLGMVRAFHAEEGRPFNHNLPQPSRGSLKASVWLARGVPTAPAMLSAMW
jgi:hypothetical protein